MARRNEGIYEFVAQLPWWIGLIFAGFTYVGMKYWLPAYAIDNHFLKGITQALAQYAWLFSGLFLISAAVSAFNAWRKGELFDSQTSLRSIKNISWQEFEEIVGEYYRRLGYTVTESGKGGADGGIDLVLTNDGEKTFVQCKQYRASRVGVSVIRELYGVMAAEGVNRGIVITTGSFTPEARQFAEGKDLELLDGDDIVPRFGKVQKEQRLNVESPEMVFCPSCSSKMLLRTARRGANSGKKFWGCSQYPRCRGIRNA